MFLFCFKTLETLKWNSYLQLTAAPPPLILQLKDPPGVKGPYFAGVGLKNKLHCPSGLSPDKEAFPPWTFACTRVLAHFNSTTNTFAPCTVTSKVLEIGFGFGFGFVLGLLLRLGIFVVFFPSSHPVDV